MNSLIERPYSKFKATFCPVMALAVLLIGPVPAHAQEFMTQSELLATLPGSQISGVSSRDDKTPWVQAYSKDNGSKKGLISGIWNK